MRKSPKQSAGLLMFRGSGETLEVFLVHPGGPFWSKQDKGAWTVPKGEYGTDEEPLAAAQREFHEETGFVPVGQFVELGSVKQKSGKIVAAWAFEGDCDPALLRSNTCQIEWPPRSKQTMTIPEIDRGAWFSSARAVELLREEQRPLVERLAEYLRNSSAEC